MELSITKAVDRIRWRFSIGKPFTANNNDIDAYNSIAKYVEKTQKQQFQNHELFAKLYIYMYMKILENDRSTVFDTNARRKLGNLLKKPMFQLVEDLTRSLNESEQYGFLEELGYEIKHPALRTELETSQQNKKLNELLKTEGNETKLLGEVWDFETVKEAMEAEVNFMINNFK